MVDDSKAVELKAVEGLFSSTALVELALPERALDDFAVVNLYNYSALECAHHLSACPPRDFGQQLVEFISRQPMKIRQHCFSLSLSLSSCC